MFSKTFIRRSIRSTQWIRYNSSKAAPLDASRLIIEKPLLLKPSFLKNNWYLVRHLQITC